MLVSQIKILFLTKFDEFQSAYVSNVRLTKFYYESQAEVFKDLMAQYQISNRVTEDVLPLVKRDTITPTSNLINLDIDVSEYNTLINIYPLYANIQWPAKPWLAEEKLSTFAQGTSRYPRYDQISNSSGDRILTLYPSTTPNSCRIDFFRNPITIDFDNPTVDIPYTDNVINLITDKAVQIASSAFRDSEYFQTSSALLEQSNTGK